MKTFAVLITVSALAVGAFFVMPSASDAEPKSGDVPVIVELFTSEGCSSCPPADATLRELSRTQPVPGANVIALGYHVDYWNRLGWRDPFSTATFTARQESYRTRFANDSNYTPQAVVAGSAEFVGSDTVRTRAEVARAAERLRKSPVRIAVAPTGSDTYKVTVNGQDGVKNPHLFVAVTESGLSTRVKSGENGGRLLSHAAVVRRLLSLGNKADVTVSLPVEAGQNPENQRVVAWLQEGETGAIFGAAQTAR